MKKFLIINGHPDKQSLCFELAKRYRAGADSAGAECQLVNLTELKFNPVLTSGYRERSELEPDLLMMQRYIMECDHLVLVYPNWWGTYPALLKGFIDRVFLPGFAFSYRENSIFWDKLLKGKSARLIVTMDTPAWYYSLIYKSPGHHSMKKGILGFSGITPVKISSIGPIKASSLESRMAWMRKVEKLGIELK